MNQLVKMTPMLERFHELEPWKRELVELIFKADREGKLLRSRYQQLVFTPMELAQNICQGRFVWGVVNWELIDPPKGAA
jgi:hypothetical protein